MAAKEIYADESLQERRILFIIHRAESFDVRVIFLIQRKGLQDYLSSFTRHVVICRTMTIVSILLSII
ncbi:MAG: hypothetical protein WKI04_04775 [Ferruginibacter sp.]